MEETHWVPYKAHLGDHEGQIPQDDHKGEIPFQMAEQAVPAPVQGLHPVTGRGKT